MKIKTVCTIAFVVVAVFVFADEPILRCDFSTELRLADHKKVGEMKGMLPRGCIENFAGWKDAKVETEAMSEDGVSFLRFQTLTSEPGQFAFTNLKFEFPGTYRVKVRSRQLTAPSLSLMIRDDGPPYRGYWSGNMTKPEWCTSEFTVRVANKGESCKRGLYFFTSKGIIDIASIEVESFDPALYLSSIRRPPSSNVRLLRRYRFPCGLPAGWSLRCDKGMDALLSGVKAEDGVDAFALSDEEFSIHSEPFQTNQPLKPHVFSFGYRLHSSSPMQLSLLDDAGKELASTWVKPSEEWSRGKFQFTPNGESIAFTLRFVGKGKFVLDRTDVALEDAPERDLNEPSVTLASEKGEIARLSRIQFIDEEPVLAATVVDAKKGSRLVVRVGDIYGRERVLKPIALAGSKIEKIEFRYDAFDDVKSGQFRVQALIEHKGRRVGEIEEFVVTRLPRLATFGCDAPASPFGAHFVPRPEVLAIMKAGGINWMRIHDAASELSGWWKLEPERGKWIWPDEQISRIRKAGISIFAQLGTAPAWATHYQKLGCKRMGYFEKYLRPVDTAAWTNYVSRYVSHYRNEIKEYFIWNEPWGDWWACGMDLKFFDPERPAEEYGEFSKLTYDAVKRVKSDALVCGFNTYSSRTGAEWTQKVASTGAYDACDAMDFHVYSPSPRLYRDEDSLSARAFGALSEKNDKPIYMSEGQGAATGNAGGNSLRMSGLYRIAVPWQGASVAECAEFSDKTVRYVISLLCEKNLKRVFLYSTDGYRALGTKPSYLTLLQADGFAHPSLVAHAQMARMLEGRKFVSKKDLGGRAVCVKFSGGCDVYAGLSLEQAKALAAKSEMFDIYGNRFDPERFFPGSVCYCVSKGKK